MAVLPGMIVEPDDDADRAQMIAAALAGIMAELSRFSFVSHRDQGMVAAMPDDAVAHALGYTRALIELTGSGATIEHLPPTTMRAQQLRMRPRRRPGR